MNTMDINKVFTIDCGKNCITYYNSSNNESGYITKTELFNLPQTLEKGFTIIGECSHIGTPRSKYSLAQPFTEEELFEWYNNLERNQIKLKLFPQKSTPRACVYSGYKKSDIDDPKAIFKLIADFPEKKLMNPPLSFNPKKEIRYFWDRKDKVNKVLNVARMDNYDIQGFRKDSNTKFILDNIYYIYDNLQPDARVCFGLKFYNKKDELKIKTQSSWSFNMAQMYSVLGSLVDYEGNFIDNEKPLVNNYKWKRYVLCSTPFHFRGGLLRSNIYYHGQKNYIISQGKLYDFDFKRKVKIDKESIVIKRGNFTKEEDAFFLKHRKIYCRAIMDLYSLYKDMIKANMYPGLEYEDSYNLTYTT